MNIINGANDDLVKNYPPDETDNKSIKSIGKLTAFSEGDIYSTSG